ncbi:helicase [Jeotgalibaca sp. PTS2502]|uniref:AAA domain-containing protein n=1 Tax=Jeotgalibaca sp. PTS2502 TaxID=1903686 RepID=UPI000973C02A|nr:AAA domain-containing protein [Jeotgalibaca sp. PTS2502]APZ48586.1 helicase [Jeotgalibaca sp. PTS2502]
MFSIYMNEQDKTNQITDWRLSSKGNQLMVTVDFPSGKSFTQPLDLCKITPQNEIEAGLLSSEENIYHQIDKATEYGDKYLVVNYPNDPKKYVMKSENVNIIENSSLKNENIFSYFTKIVKERVNQASPKNKPMAENIERQLNKVIPYKGTALHAYCYGKNEIRDSLEHYIFPFGLNESQLEAVENAFSSQISIIEGPPGTGKTQTILNIIANILVNKKTVAIVSNNNPAVENVYEKMKKKELDYLVAKLGSSNNKTEFFSALKEVPLYNSDSEAISIEEIDEILVKVRTGLTTQNIVAQLIAEISELSIEKKHLEEWYEENERGSLMNVGRYKLSPEKTSDLLAYMNFLSPKKLSFKERVRLLLDFRIFRTKFLDIYTERINFMYSLQCYYYEIKLQQKEQQLEKYKNDLKKDNFKQLLEDLTDKSMQYLNQELSKTIPLNSSFTSDNYKKDFSNFIKRFPVIGSSTHSIINSIADGAVLDYVIIDEASQQDIVPGILSLGCAKNIIVVGDRKQLPHIPEKTDIAVPSKYYDCTKYSLLDSFVKLFNDQVPITLLKEHYRCHPKIIQFCNQQFYNNKLIPMTIDEGESSIQLITTSKGNHARKRTNLREIESLIEVGGSDEIDIGFIAPYNNQVNLAGAYLPEKYARATIHKFQGRECKEIIFSTVLDKKENNQNSINFVDDPHLVNVAVSRAINKFTLVTGDDVFTRNNRSLAALVRYIKYYAPDDHVHDSPVISAFDLLYNEYDRSLEKLNDRLNLKDSYFKSERIMAAVLKDILKKEEFMSLKFHMQIDLIQIVSVKNNLFNERELEFMKQKASCDFVIYYKVGKNPMGVIEIDGSSHENRVQQERDVLKNAILQKTDIPLLRLKTVEGNIEKKTLSFLNECIIKSHVNEN